MKNELRNHAIFKLIEYFTAIITTKSFSKYILISKTQGILQFLDTNFLDDMDIFNITTNVIVSLIKTTYYLKIMEYYPKTKELEAIDHFQLLVYEKELCPFK